MYKTVDNTISNGINKIKCEIDQLNFTKNSLTAQINSLKNNVETENKNMNTVIQEAQNRAEELIVQTEQEINEVIQSKKEYNLHIYKKLEEDIGIQIKQKLIDLIIQNVMYKINTIENPESFQLINLQKSIEMLEEVSRQ